MVPTSNLVPAKILIPPSNLVPGLGGTNLKAEIRIDLNPLFQVGTKFIAGTHFEAGTNLKAGTRFEGGTRILAGTRFEVGTNLISI